VGVGGGIRHIVDIGGHSILGCGYSVWNWSRKEIFFLFKN
jgi:hypothetical protein